MHQYTEVVRFFVSRGKTVGLYIDDYAGGHNGVWPDCFLRQLDCPRVRVLGGCTSLVQAADRPQDNQVLKNSF